MSKGTIIGIISLIALVAIITFATKGKNGGDDDTRVAFAQCLAEKDVKFYGAFWCPHCNAQKSLFGKKATKELPYIECSTADAKGQTFACQEAKIASYPTWEFSDGTRLTGEQSFEKLSELSGCPVPVGYENMDADPGVDDDAEVTSQTEGELPDTPVELGDASQTPEEALPQ